jgi:putative endonuclease
MVPFGTIDRARIIPPGVVYHAPVPHVYILRCRDASLYTGATTDLARRLRKHRAGVASRYTRSRLPVRLVWKRQVDTWPEALREERRIKALTRAAKLLLVAARRVV